LVSVKAQRPVDDPRQSFDVHIGSAVCLNHGSLSRTPAYSERSVLAGLRPS
jgi:hypothetical protein